MINELKKFIVVVFTFTVIMVFAAVIGRVAVAVCFYFINNQYALTLGNLYTTAKAGLVGGAIGGIGIWLIYRFKIGQR